MALTLGQFVSGAGYVSEGMRQAEEAERLARQNQLQIEAQNRANQAAIERQAARAGLQVPSMPQFQGMAGGQPVVNSLGVPVPAAPPAPPSEPVPEVTVAPLQTDLQRDTEAFANLGLTPSGVMPAATPFGRGAQQVGTFLSEEDERRTLTQQLERQYGGQAGVRGLFMPQTAAEREQAQQIVALLRGGQLTLPQLRELRDTGRLPTPQAGVRPELLAAQQRAESGGDTTAVSPKGATGLMQVMPETAMSPGFGLPNVFDFAQQQGIEVGERTKEEAQRLLKIPEVGGSFGVLYANAMSQKYGGDEVLMLAAYNWGPGNVDRWVASGRDPRMLPAETRDYIEKTLRWAGTDQKALGATPAKTADSVAQAVAATPAIAGVMYGPSSVTGGMQDPNVQSALMLRQMLAADYEIFNRNRMFDQADQALAQVAAIDLGLYKAQADLGIQELTVSGDASRAMSVYSQFTGTPTQVLRRSDGTYDLYSNGQLAQTAVPVNQLAELVKTAVDAGYRQQKAELAKEMTIIGLEQGLKLKQEELKQIGSIQTAMINGQYDILVERAKLDGKLTVDTANGVAYLREGGKTYVVTPNAVTEVAGVQQTGPQAQAINLP